MRVARRKRSRTATTSNIQEPNLNASGLPRSTSASAHTAGHTYERRAYVRAKLSLPLSVSRIAGQATSQATALRTRDISSSGAFFLYPQHVEPGTPLGIEVSFIEERPRHRAIRMCAEAHVIRTEPTEKPGWHGLGVVFDDIRYMRDGRLLARTGVPPFLQASSHQS